MKKHSLFATAAALAMAILSSAPSSAADQTTAARPRFAHPQKISDVVLPHTGLGTPEAAAVTLYGLTLIHSADGQYLQSLDGLTAPATISDELASSRLDELEMLSAPGDHEVFKKAREVLGLQNVIDEPEATAADPQGLAATYYAAIAVSTAQGIDRVPNRAVLCSRSKEMKTQHEFVGRICFQQQGIAGAVDIRRPDVPFVAADVENSLTGYAAELIFSPGTPGLGIEGAEIDAAKEIALVVSGGNVAQADDLVAVGMRKAIAKVWKRKDQVVAVSQALQVKGILEHDEIAAVLAGIAGGPIAAALPDKAMASDNGAAAAEAAPAGVQEKVKWTLF